MFSPSLFVSRTRQHLSTTRGNRAARIRDKAHLLVLLLLLASLPALAIRPPDAGQKNLGHLTHPVTTTSLQVRPDLSASTALAPGAATHAGVDQFINHFGGSWTVRWDRRSNRPSLIQGSGVPLIPGSGNQLTKGDLGLGPAQKTSMGTVEAALQRFALENQNLLQTAGMDFRLDAANSAPYGDGRDHWFVEFDQYYKGVRVDGANLFFRLSHGNIVQFGTKRIAPVDIDVKPAMSRDDAFNAAFRQMPFKDGARIKDVKEPGQLLIMPTMSVVQPVGTRFTGSPGQGYSHVLVWRFVYQLFDDNSTYEVLFDAHSNTLLQVRDLTLYTQATVKGGVYPDSNADPEITLPMPFAKVTNGSAKTTDIDGHYDYTGGTASTSLDGKYFRMSDNCGAISLSNTTDGNLDLGSSGGTDCTTPGIGGPGNTHASRTGFYHLTLINQTAQTYYPSNTWLQSKVTANMNINDTCNAYWNGFSLNFFKSGGGCSNTGELAGVFLHEWGHGMDQNTGGSASENGSGEAVGDTFSFLYTKDSCIGTNFFPGGTCHNCSTGCTGVRDVAAFAVYGPDGTPMVGNVVAKPSTVKDPNGIDAYGSCPYYTPQGQPYQGPMGYEGHDESLIASSANWDLTRILINEFGPQQGWQQMNRIWYGSLVPSKSAYQVVSGGQCNPNAEVDGCGSDNWYTVFLAADDDDGNLSNGTPNACRIWDAFEAHGIACGARPACTGGASPDFTIGSDSPSQAVCAPDSTIYPIEIGAQQGYDEPVTLATSNLPAGVTASFSTNPVTPGSNSDLTLTADASVAAGSYDITVTGTAQDSPGHSLTVELVVTTAPPGAVTLQGPSNAEANVSTSPELSWQASADASSYSVEIATDATFSNIIDSQSGLISTTYQTGNLDFNTTYYWRVTAANKCGVGQPSAPFSFTTMLPNSYYILANLSGLQGDSVTLKLNNGDDVVRNANGAFVFPQGVLDGQDYNIIVTDQPDNPQQTCTVENGSGTIHGQNVSDVRVKCGDYVASYTVGGTITDLHGTGLVLQLNGANDLAASGSSFTFTTELASGSPYEVTVLSQPANPAQVCDISNESGTIGSSDVDDVVVACTDVVTDRIFADGFELPPPPFAKKN